MGTKRILSAARAALCVLQPCTLRMLDGHLATEPIGVDGLERKRVLDTSSLATTFPYGTDNPLTALGANAVSTVGGSQPHNNFQPYLCINFIISLFGVFPQQS